MIKMYTLYALKKYIRDVGYTYGQPWLDYIIRRWKKLLPTPTLDDLQETIHGEIQRRYMEPIQQKHTLFMELYNKIKEIIETIEDEKEIELPEGYQYADRDYYMGYRNIRREWLEFLEIENI